MAKETLVNKNDTFEDWRQKTNDISLDLGDVSSDFAYTAKSLDTESRLTDQYITLAASSDGVVHVRDVTNMEIDYAPGRTVDNTDGYIILKDGVTNTGDFLVGDTISQYAGNDTATNPQYTAQIVSISDKKILIENVNSTVSFDTSLDLYKTTDATVSIAASRLKEIIVESYNYGNVRVYRTHNFNFDASSVTNNKITLSAAAYNAITNGDFVEYTTPTSGGIYGSANNVTYFYAIKNPADAADKTIQLSTTPAGSAATLATGTNTQTLSTQRRAIPQNMTAKGFHIANQKHYAPHSASSIPVTFVEGEVLYQGASGSPTFQGTLLTADISGVLIFKNVLSGAYDPAEDLISTTVVDGAGTTLSGSAIKIANANLTGTLVTAPINYAQMIELNSPAPEGDDFKVYFGSTVDAVLELQDDVGTVENLKTNTKADLTVAVNELEVAIRGTSDNLVSTDLTTAGNMTATNVVSALLEHEADLFGAEGANKRTLSSLGTDDKDCIVDAINELETAIRGDGANLVSTDLGTSRPTASSAGNLLDAVEELYADVGDVTNTNLGTKVGNESDITTKIKAIDDFISNTALTSNNNVNIGVPATHTVTDTLKKLMDLIGTDEDWKQVGTTKQEIATTQTSADDTVILTAANPAIKVGQGVTGTDIATNTTVQSISGTTLTLSQNSSGPLSATNELTFIEADTLVNAIEFIHREIGDVISLSDDNLGNTPDKPGDLTTAINAIKSFIGTADISGIDNGSDNTITSALDQLYTDIGEVGANGVTLTDTALPSTKNDLTKAVVDIVLRMTGSVEFDTQAFHSTHTNGLAGKAGYSSTDFLAAIREIQTYLGDVSTLSNDGDEYTATAGSSHDGTSVSILTLASAPDSAVDVGYEVKMTDDGTEIPASTKVIKVNTARTEFTLDNNITIDASTDAAVTFTEPSGYGFASDVVTDSLIALRTALVGGTADLDDKIATLDDSDGAETDFAATNIVDAIRELQDDLGRRTQITSSVNANNAGTFSNDTIKDAINFILGVIGAADISNIDNGGDNTITSALDQLYTDIGDVGVTGANLDTDANDLKSAINEHEANIGNMSFTGLGATNISAALRELRADIGDVTNTNLGTNILQTITKNTEATQTATGQKNIVLDNVTDIVTGMPVGGHGSIPTNAYVESISGTTITLSEDLTGTIPADHDLTFNVVDVITKVKGLDSAIGDITDIDNATGYTATTVVTGITEIQGAIGDVDEINDTAGYTATTAVGGITEIQGKIGEVTAANLGTTSSTLVTAIKELVDGSGADSVTVATVGSQSRTGKLDKVSGTTEETIDTHGTITPSGQKNITLTDASSVVVGAVVTYTGGNIPEDTYVESISGTTITLSEDLTGAIPADTELTFTMDQTIISNIHFNAPHTSDSAKSTTLTFGPNTTLDISAGTLITEGANADFETTAKKIVLGSSIKHGQGLKIDRNEIDDAISISNDAEFLWVDTKVAQVDPDTGHNESDLAWQITGFGYDGPHLNSVIGDDGDGAVITSTQANVDFYNAYRLFGIGTTNIASTQDNITVTWDSVNQNFDISLDDTTVTANTYGDASHVAQFTVDAQGRITGASEVNISGALGEFTLQADGSAQQIISVNETVKIAGTNNEIETSITESSGTNIITIGLPADVTIANDLTVGGAISASGGSIGFTEQSAAVSSKNIVLNSPADNAPTDISATSDQAYIPAGAFISHRGFQNTAIDGGAGDLIQGTRYKIIVEVTHTITSTEQAALQAIAGTSDDLADNSVITAATTGHSTIGSSTDITLRKQEPEAKIAWNETDDTWDLYRGSDTVAGSILAQGDTIGSSTKYTSDETDDNVNYRVLFSGGADGTDDANYIDHLRSDNGFYYNATSNALYLSGDNSKIIAAGGTSLLGGLEAKNGLFGRTNGLDGADVENEDHANITIQGSYAALKLKELKTTNDIASNANVNDVTWWNVASSGNWSIRLNNEPHEGSQSVPHAIDINSNDDRDSITDIVLTAKEGIKFRHNETNNGVSTLSHTADSTKTIASFIGRTAYSDSSLLSNLHIQDVRITGETAEAQTAANASKRIQHSIGDKLYSFIDFQGNSPTDNEIRLGGYYYSASTPYSKSSFKANVKGSTELYHNTDNTDASDLTLKTVNDGMRYYGTLITNFDEPVIRYNDTGTTSVFKGATPVADLQGPLVETTGVDQATNVVIRNGSHHNSVANRTVGLTLTNGPAKNSTGTILDNDNNFKKGVDLYIKSESSYGVEPDFFIDRSDGNKRVLINYEGDIGFYNQSATQTVKFKWDASHARLGIGTDAPSANLHVTSGVGANGNCTLLVQADSDNSVETAVPIIELKSDGELTQSKLYHSGESNSTYELLENSTVIGQFGNPDAAADKNAIQFATGGTASGWTGGEGSPTARMTITRFGKVGINTTAPSEQFEVNGDARISKTTINNSGNIRVGLVDDGGDDRVVGHIQVADILPGEKYHDGDNEVAYDKNALRLHAGESHHTYTTAYNAAIAAHEADPDNVSFPNSDYRQEHERVYINAEGGLEINSSPNNWDNATDQAWENRNTTVISKADGSSEFGGKISHQGLILTSGREIDQIYSTGEKTLGATDYKGDWVDVPDVEGNALEAGSYIIQLYVHEGSGGIWNETYTGVMSWHAGNTNSSLGDEILLHNAGHASHENNKGWFLRTLRTLSAASGGEEKLKLQIRSDHNAVDDGIYTIKLRRML